MGFVVPYTLLSGPYPLSSELNSKVFSKRSKLKLGVKGVDTVPPRIDRGECSGSTTWRPRKPTPSRCETRRFLVSEVVRGAGRITPRRSSRVEETN